MYKNNFKNEINNKITIKIKNVKDTGINNKTGNKYKFDAINIKLIGPTSMYENIITYNEAKEIYKGLSVFFKNNKMEMLEHIP